MNVDKEATTVKLTPKQARLIAKLAVLTPKLTRHGRRLALPYEVELLDSEEGREDGRGKDRSK